MINFEYLEDREYFANLLANRDIEKLESDFSELFDFENPAIKGGAVGLVDTYNLDRVSGQGSTNDKALSSGISR